MNQNINIVDYKKISNLSDLFQFQLKKTPFNNFLYSRKANIWKGYSFSELYQKIIKISSFLQSKNVRKNDRVLLISSNRVEWFISDMAILSIGGITVPSFSTNNIDDNRFILLDSDPSMIIIENIKIYKKNISILSKFRSKIFFIDNNPNFVSFENVYSQKFSKIRIPKINKKDICSIIYTSGTSGKPKGVMLSHGAIIHNCEAAFELLRGIRILNEKFLSFLPLSHSYERMAGLYFPLSIGAKIYYCESLDKINRDFLDIRPTLVTAVPRLYESIFKKINSKFEKESFLVKLLFKETLRLGEKKRIKKLFFSEKLIDYFLEHMIRNKIKRIFGGKLKTFISGGAALDPDIGNFFLNMGCNILQGYGQTEAGPLISCNSLIENKTLTVGKPVKNVLVKISSIGEILVKGENVMKGYWKNQRLTEETIRNNWLHTGDLGYFDQKNRLIINGRKKDLIVTSGGENISPQKIENHLILHEEIEQSIVFGDSKPYLVAIIVLKKNAKKEIIKEKVSTTNKKLNAPEKIRKYLIIFDQFTYENGFLTQTLKIKREKVFKFYKEQINALY